MIVPMKKVHLVFHAPHLSKDIINLQELGLVDIEYGSYDLESELGKEYLMVANALEVFKTYNDGANDVMYESEYKESVDKVASHIVSYSNEINELRKNNEELTQTYNRVKNFGEVSAKHISALANRGIQVKLYKTDKKMKTPRSTENVFITKIHSEKNTKYYSVCIYQNAEYEVPHSWEEFELSSHTPSEIQNTIEINNKQIAEIIALIQMEYGYNYTLSIRKVELENKLLRESVMGSGRIYEDQLVVINGFIAVSHHEKLRAYAIEHAWGMVSSDPDEEDDVPTLHKNIKPVTMIRPLFALMDTVPGYKEFDISMLFLLFLTLFYSMIIGDAGYGALMLIGVFFASIHAARKNTMSLTHWLLLWFSSATVVWGSLTGNWFGYEPLARLPVLRSLIYEPIAVNNESSTETIMLFCLRLGLAHLLIAHLWKCIRVIRENFWSVLHQIANGAMLVGLYYVTLFLLLDPNKYPLPDFIVPIIIASYVAVILTSEQVSGQNFFKGVGKGLANFFTIFLGVVGSLADIISYIRLFAVGLASLAIAITFNDMGASIMAVEAHPIVGGILIAAGILVIAVGHTLNLAMALLAVMVHGVRLNMLEFGMHLGMEWTGRRYAPFQKKLLSLEENR